MNVVDLCVVPGAGGVVWSVSPKGFHANLVVLDAGASVAEHRNDEVDVLVVVLAGTLTLLVDGTPVQLNDRQAVLVPLGTSRVICAGREGARYLTVHSQRSLTIGAPGTVGV